MFLFSAPWRFFSLRCCFFSILQDFGDPRLANQASLVAHPQEQQHVSVLSTMEIFFIEVLLLQHPPGFWWSTAGQSSFLGRSSTGTAAYFCSQHHGDFFIEVLLLQHPPGFWWSAAGQSSFLSRCSTGTAACFCSQHHGDFFHWIVASSAASMISVIHGWPIKLP